MLIRNVYLLGTGGSDNQIYVWDLQTMNQIGTLKGHTGSITSLDYQNGILVSGSYDTQIRFWGAEKIAEIIDTRANPILR